MPGYVAIAAQSVPRRGTPAVKLLGVASGHGDRGGLWDGGGLFVRRRRGCRRAGVRPLARRHRRLERHRHRHARGRAAAPPPLGARCASRRAVPARRVPSACHGSRRLRARRGAAVGGVAALASRGAGRAARRRSPEHAGRGAWPSCAFALGPAQPRAVRRALLHRQPRRPHRPRGRQPQYRRRYSRSLNRCSREGPVFAVRAAAPGVRCAAYSSPRVDAARAGLRVGLLAAKADRLLTMERPLLYWPSTARRASGGRRAALLEAHRVGLERPPMSSGYALVVTTLVGIVGRRRPAQLAGPLPRRPCPSRWPPSTRFLRRGPLSPGHRGAAAAVRRGGDDWLIDLPRYRLSDRPSAARLRVAWLLGAGRDGRVPRMAAPALRRRTFARPPPLRGLRLLRRGNETRLRLSAHRSAARAGAVARAWRLGRLRLTRARPTDGRCHHARPFAGEVPRLDPRRICGACAGGERGRRAFRRVGRAGLGSSGPRALARCRDVGHARGRHRTRGRAFACRSGRLSGFLACFRRTRGTLDVDDSLLSTRLVNA